MQVNIYAKTFFWHTHCKYSIVETRLSICTMHNSIDWIKHFSSLLSIFYRWRVANYRWQHGGCNIFLKTDRFGTWQMKTLIRFFFHDLTSNNMISIWHIFIWTCKEDTVYRTPHKRLSPPAVHASSPIKSQSYVPEPRPNDSYLSVKQIHLHVQ